MRRTKTLTANNMGLARKYIAFGNNFSLKGGEITWDTITELVVDESFIACNTKERWYTHGLKDSNQKGHTFPFTQEKLVSSPNRKRKQ